MALTVEAQELFCDVLLLFTVSTEKNKLRAAAKEFGFTFERRTHSALGRYYTLGNIGAWRVRAVQTEMGPFSYGGSASKAIFFREASGASGIVQLGMAFGVSPDHQEIGDVLVSSSLIPYDLRTVNRHPNWWQHLRGRYALTYDAGIRHPAKASLLSAFTAEAQRRPESGPYRVHVGTILSGGARVFCRRFRDELVSSLPPANEKIVGGDMEGVGLLSVSKKDDPRWIVVKGISDFADEGRHEHITRTRDRACENAARFVLAALFNSSPA